MTGSPLIKRISSFPSTDFSSFPSSGLGTHVFEALLRGGARQLRFVGGTDAHDDCGQGTKDVASRPSKRSFEDVRSQAGAWERVKSCGTAKTGPTLLLIILAFNANFVAAEEQLRAESPDKDATSTTPAVSLIGGLHVDFSGLSKSILDSRAEVPPRPRVSRSRRPLRRITLAGGDRFDAEYLAEGTNGATFRMLNGQAIRVPTAALAALTNPAGEIDVLDESFEAGSAIESDPVLAALMDQTQAADGRRSLGFRSNSPEYRQALAPPLTSARIEFWFRIGVDDPSFGCGEWQLECGDGEAWQPPIVVRIGSDRRISAMGVPRGVNATSQSVGVDDGWHTFIALLTPGETRLIVDEAILASFPAPRSPIRAIRFPARGPASMNVLWIDALQVRSLRPAEREDRFAHGFVDRDTVYLAGGDALFGRLLGVTRAAVSVEAFGEKQSLPWNQLSGIAWKQPAQPVQQTTRPMDGVVSQIELQPYVDRPELTPARWTVTVLSGDSNGLIAQHPLVGELTIPWSEVRRIDSTFFGQMLLVDARKFHLGDSIRPDFQRHLPDGTELETNFRLDEIPTGRPWLTLEVSELEAAGPTAPPGSPFLAELRAGRLITEAFLNDHRIGSVNSLIRFKATSQNPDRVRLAVPRGILNVGENRFRLRQQPRKYPGREFDDCEVGNFRLEFDLTEGNP